LDLQEIAERLSQCHIINAITAMIAMNKNRLTQMRQWPLACKLRRTRVTHRKDRLDTLVKGTKEAHLKAIKEVRLRDIKGVLPKVTKVVLLQVTKVALRKAIKEVRNRGIRHISTSKAHNPSIKVRVNTRDRLIIKEDHNRIHILGARHRKLIIHIKVNHSHFEGSLC
jgi:hypothetical protein